MATTNLSNYNFDDVPSAKGMKIAIVCATWNKQITDGLLQGAKQTIIECGCDKQIWRTNLKNAACKKA